jgi:hypothetical protein
MERLSDSAKLTSADELITLKVQANVAIVRCGLVEGGESCHYLEKTPLPLIEIEIHESGTLTTDVHRRA